ACAARGLGKGSSIPRLPRPSPPPTRRDRRGVARCHAIRILREDQEPRCDADRRANEHVQEWRDLPAEVPRQPCGSRLARTSASLLVLEHPVPGHFRATITLPRGGGGGGNGGPGPSPLPVPPWPC